MVRQRIVVGLADDLQIVVRPVVAHLLQQFTELGDGEDVGRDLVAKRRHSAIIRCICRCSVHGSCVPGALADLLAYRPVQSLAACEPAISHSATASGSSRGFSGPVFGCISSIITTQAM